MTASSPSGMRILVVDDEPFVCEAVKLMLENDGHAVEVATNGKAALKLFAQKIFDLVLTDFNMPDMKGDELAERIKQQDPTQPVVMITAHPEVLSPKIEGVIGKPFRLQDLRNAVARFKRRPSQGTQD